MECMGHLKAVLSLTEIENINFREVTSRTRSKTKLSNNFNESKIDDEISYIAEFPAELLLEILRWCDLASVVNLSTTCRRLFIFCVYADEKWKQLLHQDFNVSLTTKGKFQTFSEIYRLVYCSRILIASFTYSRYFNKIRLKPLPHWLMVWASLSENPPIMRYGKHRVTRRVRGQYLKKFNDFSYGQVKSVFKLNGFTDLMRIYPTRQQKGTVYFPWRSVKWAAHQKHRNYESFMLEKCFRARGFIERNYVKVRGSNPINIL